MTDAIVFRTPGLIDLRSFTVMGFNAKLKANPIGFFGTGLKLAVGVVLRLGGSIVVYIGRDKYTFYVKEVDFRGKAFSQVWMRSERWHLTRARNTELPFTTEFGKNWEPWMAFRELHSNTLDEDGETFEETFSVEFEINRGWNEGHTTIVVSGIPAFVEAYENRAAIFLDRDAAPLVAEDHGVAIREGSTSLLYYQGIRAKEVPKPTLYTYDFRSTISLTEDRTFAHDWHVRQNLAAMVSQCDDEELIQRIVTAPEKNWEHGLEFPNHYKPSDAFRRVMARRPRGVSSQARGYYGRYDTSPVLRSASPWHTAPRPWRLEGDNIVDASGSPLFSVPYEYQHGNWDFLALDFLKEMSRDGVDTAERLLEWNCTEPEDPVATGYGGEDPYYFRPIAAVATHGPGPVSVPFGVGDPDDDGVPF